MKEVKTFIIVDIIVAIIKVLGGLVCNSYAMIASSVLDVVFVITSISVKDAKDNKKYKGIISALFGLVVVLSGLGLIFLTTLVNIKKTSFFILLFILVTILVKYVVGCFYTNLNYQKKRGILNYGNVNSNMDFLIYGIILGTFIIGKFSKWVDILKYADMLGLCLIAIIVILKGIKIIVSSFRYLEEREKEITDEFKEEISKREEIKSLAALDINSFGGIRQVRCDITLKTGLSILDANTFVVTLQDYLLKVADVVIVNLVEPKVVRKTKTKVRSKKQDARNSRSGNSKTNTKKKSSTKKSKKR